MTLKVFLSPTRDEQGRFGGVVQAFPDIWRGLVLDVGCRSGNLKYALPSGAVYYYGLDLFPPADVLGNLGTGLPFKNVSFDTVVALDVLEHTDNIHRAFGELCRIARKYVLIILPNVYDLKLRICVLMGRKFLDRHGLPPIWSPHRTSERSSSVVFFAARGSVFHPHPGSTPSVSRSGRGVPHQLAPSARCRACACQPLPEPALSIVCCFTEQEGEQVKNDRLFPRWSCFQWEIRDGSSTSLVR